MSWLGDVPKHWSVKAAKFVASYNDDTLPEDTDPNAEIAYVEISDVEESRGIVGTTLLRFKDSPSRARRKVVDGDIIISTVRTYLKAIAPIDAPPDNLVVSTGFAVLRPHGVAQRYARYAFSESGFINAVIARSTGVSYPAINASELVQIPIPVPTAEEQVAISAYLDTETARIDALIVEKERLIETLYNYRRTVITDVVSAGLKPDVERQATGGERFGNIPKHWRMVPLKRFVRIQGGHTPSTEQPAYWDGSIPWISAKDMKLEVLHDSIDHITERAIAETSLSIIPPGATLVVVRGMILAHSLPVARNAVAATINQDMKALVPQTHVLPEYLPWLLRGATPIFLSLTEQSAHGTMALRTDKFLGEPLPIPPEDEQVEMVEYLDRTLAGIDDLVRHVEQEVCLLRELRSSTITDAVLGRFRVSWAKPTK